MEKKFRILYLKDKNSKNTELIDLLRKKYATNVFYFILPDVIEKRFGHLNFSTIKEVNDLDWDEAIACTDSQDDISYKYGIDYFSDNPDTRSFGFRNCLKTYFENLNLKFTEKTKIRKIISSVKRSKIFLRENSIFIYDLIVIENLASSILHPITKEDLKLHGSDFYKNYKPAYTQYKITPELINKILNSNSKLLFLMDYTSHSDINERYKKMLEKIGVCSFSIYRDSLSNNHYSYPDKLIGIDFENRLKDTLCEFEIINTADYMKNITDKFSIFYKNVKNIFINYPIQFSSNSKNNIKRKDKIILSGNKTTKLYLNWENDIYDFIKKNEIVLNIENKKGSETVKQISTFDERIAKLKEFKDIRILKNLNHLKDFDYLKSKPQIKFFEKFNKEKPIFGIADTLYNSTYSILTGNLCCNEFLQSNICDNRIFIENILNFLVTQAEYDLELKKDYLPKIRMEIKTGEIFISFNTQQEYTGETKIQLSKMEFCYYRYFLERAIRNLEFTTVTEEPRTGYNDVIINDFADNNISSTIIKTIISYYVESFPNAKGINRTEDKIDKTKNTPNIKKTFRPLIFNINKKIKTSLGNILSERLIKYIRILHEGELENTTYGIRLPSENISINPINSN